MSLIALRSNLKETVNDDCMGYTDILREKPVKNLQLVYLKQNEFDVLHASNHLKCTKRICTSGILIILSPDEYSQVQWVCKD